MSRREYNDFIVDSYKKGELLTVIGGSFIIVFELLFAILNLVTKDRTVYSNLYLVAYLVLFVVSVISVGFCVFFKKNKYYKELLPWFIHIFVILIIIWSFTISFLDIYGDDAKAIEYPIVFLTVSFAIPFFLKTHYMTNAVLSGAGFIAILIEANLRAHKLLIGYTSNLFVAAVMIVLVSILGYRVTYKNYLLEKTLQESSTKDGLTKLYNRGALDDKLEEVSKSNNLFNIIMLDCDNFKTINDSYGHRVGDEALVKIAELIQREFGEDCYRYGGDEFIVITTFTGNTARDSLMQINAELAEFFGEVHVSITAGIYLIENGSSVGKIIKCVDSALYEAKKTKKGTVAIYEE